MYLFILPWTHFLAKFHFFGDFISLGHNTTDAVNLGPKRLFATIKTEESHRYNLIDCLKISNPDGKFKILVKLEPGLNWLNFEFCRVVRHFVVNCTSKYAQVEQSHKIKLVYIIASDSDGGFQVSFYIISDGSGIVLGWT